MLQEQNETERLNFISWRVSLTEVPRETAMDHLFSCIHQTILLQKKKKKGYTLIHIYYQHSIYPVHA